MADFKGTIGTVPEELRGSLSSDLSLSGRLSSLGIPGNGIASIELTSTDGLTDTYTITYDDGATTTYQITNGNGIVSAVFNDDNTLTLSFDDGTVLTTGVLRGDDGEKVLLKAEHNVVSYKYESDPNWTTLVDLTGFADDASNAADRATAKAEEARQSAIRAENSASDANASAGIATTKAEGAASSEEQAGISMRRAETAASDALASKNLAQEAAATATTAQDNARIYSERTLGYANNAAQSAQSASNSAASAAQSAVGLGDAVASAQQSARDAASSASQAREYYDGIDEVAVQAMEDYLDAHPAVQSVNGKTRHVVLNAEDVGALPEDTFIPSKITDLTNDAGYLTEHQDISGKADTADLVWVKGTGENSAKTPWATEASGDWSVAEGATATASGPGSHAEGMGTIASGGSSHSEGALTTASGAQSHAEGVRTIASSFGSHAEGTSTKASGFCSHAEGAGATASGDYSHAEGYSTIAASAYQHVQGKYNVEDTNNTYAHIVGGGADSNNRKNIQTIDWNGNEAIAGSLTLGKDSADEVELTAETVKNLITNTIEDVQINGTSIVENGVANIPMASPKKLGAVKAETQYGLDATISGLRIYPASSGVIKVATGSGSLYQPITPYHQHESVFYGLAKAAGHDEKDSTLPMGQYTDEAKSAIKTMLGVSEPSILIDDTATTGDMVHTWSANKIETELANAGTVQDVQVNGTSVVENGVANVPIASANTFGTIKVGEGLTMWGGQSLRTLRAAGNTIKAGSNSFYPIVPEQQHTSTFYGLAKAAGHDEKDSTLAMGTYTPEAKSAIQNMLGVTEAITAALADIVGIEYRVCGEGEYDAQTFIPTIEGKAGVIYLVPKPVSRIGDATIGTAEVSGNNIYYEFIYNGDSFEMIGDTSASLDGYLNEDDVSEDSEVQTMLTQIFGGE